MLYSELEAYFIERFGELLNKKTPDSYRVRYHNSLSILQEFHELIEGWQKRRIQSYETVSLCAKECIALLEADQCLAFNSYDKGLFIKDIEDYISKLPDSKEKRECIYDLSSKVRYVSRKCVNENTGIYVKNLFDFILNEISKPGDMDADNCFPKEMKVFDWATSVLCTELLRLGYSKNHLYLKSNQLSKHELTILELRNYFIAQKPSDYGVLFKMNATNDVIGCKDAYGFTENADDVMRLLTNKSGYTQNKSFFNVGDGVLFRKFEVSALDTYSAIKKAKAELAMLLDTLHLGVSTSDLMINNMVIVYTQAPTGYYSERRNSEYKLDGEYFNDPLLSVRLKNDIGKILESNYVKEDAKEYTMEVAAPGIKKEYCRININNDGNLEVAIENKLEHKEENKKEHYLRREFSYSNYQQTYILPDNVDKDKISAKVNDGVLEIKLPKFTKEEESRAQRAIEIK